jgi:hypothetical protein
MLPRRGRKKWYVARTVNPAWMDEPEPTWRQVVDTSLQMRVRLSSASDRRPSLAARRAGPDRKFLKKCCLTKNSQVDKWKELKKFPLFSVTPALWTTEHGCSNFAIGNLKDS